MARKGRAGMSSFLSLWAEMILLSSARLSMLALTLTVGARWVSSPAA